MTLRHYRECELAETVTPLRSTSATQTPHNDCKGISTLLLRIKDVILLLELYLFFMLIWRHDSAAGLSTARIKGEIKLSWWWKRGRGNFLPAQGSGAQML